MVQHPSIAKWILRIGLAIVFVWFGIDKFIQPQYWLDAWVPAGIQSLVVSLGATPKNLVFFVGIIEVLIAISLATGFFLRVFAGVGVVFLAAVAFTHGMNEVLIRDIGLLAGLASLVFWSERSYS